MIIALWILNVTLAALFAWTGFLKAVRPIDSLDSIGWHWTRVAPKPLVRALGVAEILGSVGLVLPLATGVLPFLTPISAACLTVLMIGAITLHSSRKEPIVQNIVIAALTLTSAIVSALYLSGSIS